MYSDHRETNEILASHSSKADDRYTRETRSQSNNLILSFTSSSIYIYTLYLLRY